jgi:hypothetical protein
MTITYDEFQGLIDRVFDAPVIEPAPALLALGMFLVWCWQPDSARLIGETFSYQLAAPHEVISFTIELA